MIPMRSGSRCPRCPTFLGFAPHNNHKIGNEFDWSRSGCRIKPHLAVKYDEDTGAEIFDRFSNCPRYFINLMINIEADVWGLWVLMDEIVFGKKL